MIKAINQWSFPGGLSLNSCMELAFEAGFRAFEPAFAEDGELSLVSTDKEVSAIKALADEKGMQLTSLASGLYWKYSPTSNDAAIRLKALELIKRQLHCAKILGVDTILMVPGTVGEGFWGEGADYDVAYDRAGEFLNGVKVLAKDCGVVIGVENVWNNFLLSPLEIKKFIDDISSDFVKFYFDVGNALIQGFPEQWIRILGNRICKVHVKDYRRSVGTYSGFVDLLSGDVDFAKVVSALKEVGYEGYIIAEVAAINGYPSMAAYRASAALDAILK